MSINHEANEHARTFDRIAKMHGYDLRMETLAELIALFEVALSPPATAAHSGVVNGVALLRHTFDEHCEPCITAEWCALHGRCLAQSHPDPVTPCAPSGMPEWLANQVKACRCEKFRHPHDPAEHNPDPDYGF